MSAGACSAASTEHSLFVDEPREWQAVSSAVHTKIRHRCKAETLNLNPILWSRARAPPSVHYILLFLMNSTSLYCNQVKRVKRGDNRTINVRKKKLGLREDGKFTLLPRQAFIVH